jgi:hypothetical protein
MRARDEDPANEDPIKATPIEGSPTKVAQAAIPPPDSQALARF